MRFWRQAWRDLVWLGSRVKETEGLIKIIAPIVLLFVTVVASAIIKRDWWLTAIKSIPISPASLVLSSLALMMTFYFGFIFARSRLPILKVGRLEPDEREHCFHMKVQSLGPGSIQPVATLTYLTDEDGQLLQTEGSYRDSEIHWRHFTEAKKRPTLDEGGKAYAGPFLVNEIDTDSPRLWLFPIDLEPKPLWLKPIPLEKQKALRVKLTFSYRAKGVEMNEVLVVKRAFNIKPDRRCALRYKIKRVYIRSWFWR